jgi:hypothetical protein
MPHVGIKTILVELGKIVLEELGGQASKASKSRLEIKFGLEIRYNLDGLGCIVVLIAS